ncbi:MAG TPA: response regulator transcription factor [Candidatus Anaerobutyricum stercoripullorum]|uniref:Stage 0 sporulation protein A homolog n=1 Tax=Candidatus Anaerobutyricum stercoripullorum TaxID=2838456 RepID=A0A9D2BEE8_9FIRM|nr:response regulator transcription factor [Candidatus Anaerobutyricum stercoripullorum]
MYRIFMIEDDEGILNAVKKRCEKWEMEVSGVANYREILAEFVKKQPHLVIMDIGLPAFDGYHWCREIRRISNVPILFLSSAADNMNQIMAMNMGGDDFIAKPFDYDVLIAKMQALLRRAYDFAGHMPVLECRGAFLYLEKNTLTYGDAVITLTKNEHRILSLLMENKDSIVSRERLMDALWESDCYVDDNTLSVNVNRLRKKLEANGLSDFIGTKFGVGYYIREEKDDGKE